MERPKVKLVNAQTGEETIREMNNDEFAKWQEDQANFEAAELARANADATKAALLAKLGITDEEARLLLG
jgi:hypothetical protein